MNIILDDAPTDKEEWLHHVYRHWQDAVKKHGISDLAATVTIAEEDGSGLRLQIYPREQLVNWLEDHDINVPEEWAKPAWETGEPPASHGAALWIMVIALFDMDTYPPHPLRLVKQMMSPGGSC